MKNKFRIREIPREREMSSLRCLLSRFFIVFTTLPESVAMMTFLLFFIFFFEFLSSRVSVAPVHRIVGHLERLIKSKRATNSTLTQWSLLSTVFGDDNEAMKLFGLLRGRSQSVRDMLDRSEFFPIATRDRGV